jgi:dihydrofolate reductase
MRISLIAALAENRVIGRENQLPWRISADLGHFKAVTMGKPIIMGRRTFESIGRPLPGRTNIVITRDESFQADDILVVHSIERALAAAEGHDEVMVIGGANVYRQLLPRATRLYLTEVKATVEGDAWFPEFDNGEWQEIERESHTADDRNEFDYDFVVLERT